MQTDIQISFATHNAIADSEIMKKPPDIIGDGLVKKFVAKWMEKWQGQLSRKSVGEMASFRS